MNYLTLDINGVRSHQIETPNDNLIRIHVSQSSGDNVRIRFQAANLDSDNPFWNNIEFTEVGYLGGIISSGSTYQVVGTEKFFILPKIYRNIRVDLIAGNSVRVGLMQDQTTILNYSFQEIVDLQESIFPFPIPIPNPLPSLNDYFQPPELPVSRRSSRTSYTTSYTSDLYSKKKIPSVLDYYDNIIKTNKIYKKKAQNVDE